MQRRDLLCFALFSSLPLYAKAQPVKPQAQHLNISTLLENDPATFVAEKILSVAYQQLGISITVQKLPGERSLYSANNGESDGELYRKIGMEKDYPNLIIVPIPLQIYEIVIFTQGTDFVVNGWESLRPFVVGYVKGIKIIEKNTVGMHVEQAATMRQAFLKMNLGRSDVVVANRNSGLAVLKELKMEGVKILKPALASFPVFHYLHKKHEALVPKITVVLKKMQRDKTIETIQKEVYSKLDLQ